MGESVLASFFNSLIKKNGNNGDEGFYMCYVTLLQIYYTYSCNIDIKV